MHLHRASLAFLLLLPSVLGEPSIDGYLNARAALITPAPRAEEPTNCQLFLFALSNCRTSPADFICLNQEQKASVRRCLCLDDPNVYYSFKDAVDDCFSTDGMSPELVTKWIDLCHNNAPSCTPKPRPRSRSVIGQPSPAPTPVGNPSVTPTSPPTPEPDHKGEIAGGVVGGIAGLAAIVGVATIIRKRIAIWFIAIRAKMHI